MDGTPFRFGLPVHVDPGVLKLGQIVDLLDLYHYQTSKATGVEREPGALSERQVNALIASAPQAGGSRTNWKK